MTKTFTHADVLRYVYEETSADETALIAEALLADTNLLAFYFDTIDLKAGLDRIQLSPSDRLLANVMAYSRQYPNSRRQLAYN